MEGGHLFQAVIVTNTVFVFVYLKYKAHMAAKLPLSLSHLPLPLPTVWGETKCASGLPSRAGLNQGPLPSTS